MSFTDTARRMAGAALAAALLTGLPTAAPTYAANSTGCEGGAFKVTMPNGQVLATNAGFKFAPGTLPTGGIVQIRGKYVEYDLNVSTFAIYNATMTGAANALDMTGGQRTVLFASKVPDLSPTALDDGELNIQISTAKLVVQRKGRSASMKIQASDCATGGIFQMEPEQDTTFTHTLAPGMYYFKNPYTGKINFGNGTMLRGKDSPQSATRLTQTDTVTTWKVLSGGRMGMVMGEDSVEASAGATPCVQQCQASEQIQGSLAVTDPAFSA
jgi:hypothetical protein